MAVRCFVLLFALLLCFVQSVPVVLESSSNQTINIDEAIKATGYYDREHRPVFEHMEGMDWQHVLDLSECNIKQQDIIEDAFHTAAYVILIPTILDGGKIDLNNAWNRFFMNDNEAAWGYGWTTRGDRGRVNKDAFEAIVGNFRKAATFYPTGYVEGHWVQRSQIHRLKVRCKEVYEIGRCESRNTAAYVTEPLKDEDGQWAMTICPKWFTRRVESIVDVGKMWKTLDNLPQMMSREHVILHEWMHCDLPKFRQHIKDELWFGGPVNGAANSHDFAWVNAFRSDQITPAEKPAINLRVETNADNYAWYLTNRWFEKLIEWRDPSRGRDI
ncbi:hypothetical protein LTR84_007153 [Exophiala bonariae]|uniref:Lysine-specific metallo-endopeptidase domain-containing protein n=1 Tax=Exophiala bonariae TaxID=1690606 RepID=A0AAV9MYI8_9EURO|nr:hypothetical protein LTR84_007153 [Exophiala bonariae]